MLRFVSRITQGSCESRSRPPRRCWATATFAACRLGNLGSVLGNWAYLVALLVYAYDEGGAALVGLSTIVRVIPAALAGPSRRYSATDSAAA